MSPDEFPLKRAPAFNETVADDPEATGTYLAETVPSPASRRVGVLDESASYGFLEPPRSTDELGWLAHYRVLRLIGQGGMGLVFQAEDEHLGRSVALKVIRPELAGTPEASLRFTREARAAAAIKHDHVVTIYQVGQQDHVAFLAMEYLQGISLDRWLDRGRKPSIDLILRIGREVASGLAAAHGLGLIHRDIKPANIWLETPQGRVKILDFGHARAARDEDVMITQAGGIMGTPAFMAPEQARGDSVDATCDLFSLGCVLYRLCTGRLPFQGVTIMAVLTALSAAVPPSPRQLDPSVPLALDALVMQLLAKNSEDRPASALAVVEAIRAIERQCTTERQSAELAGGTPKPPEAARPRAFPRFLPVAAALGVVIISLAWTSTIFLSSHSKVREVAAPRPTETVVSVKPIDPIATPVVDVPKAIAQPLPLESTGPPKQPDLPPLVVKAAIPDVVKPEIPPPPPPAPEIQGRSESDWGVFIDPDGDCKVALNLERRRAEIDVPGKPHVLSAELGRVNAPRILRNVRGDFEARVRVTGIERPSGRATTAEYAPYHGAGLLIWQDEENYVRLEIASQVRKGKPFHYANFESRKKGRLAYSKRLDFDDQTSELRLQRKAGVIRAAISRDGLRWTSFPPLDVDLDVELKIGVAAINTATKPLMAVLEDFRISPTLSSNKILP